MVKSDMENNILYDSINQQIEEANIEEEVIASDIEEDAEEAQDLCLPAPIPDSEQILLELDNDLIKKVENNSNSKRII